MPIATDLDRTVRQPSSRQPSPPPTGPSPADRRPGSLDMAWAQRAFDQAPTDATLRSSRPTAARVPGASALRCDGRDGSVRQSWQRWSWPSR